MVEEIFNKLVSHEIENLHQYKLELVEKLKQLSSKLKKLNQDLDATPVVTLDKINDLFKDTPESLKWHMNGNTGGWTYADVIVSYYRRNYDLPDLSPEQEEALKNYNICRGLNTKIADVQKEIKDSWAEFNSINLITDHKIRVAIANSFDSLLPLQRSTYIEPHFGVPHAFIKAFPREYTFNELADGGKCLGLEEIMKLMTVPIQSIDSLIKTTNLVKTVNWRKI